MSPVSPDEFGLLYPWLYNNNRRINTPSGGKLVHTTAVSSENSENKTTGKHYNNNKATVRIQ